MSGLIKKGVNSQQTQAQLHEELKTKIMQESQLLKKIDEQDGKKDGKISKSIWNEYAKDFGQEYSVSNDITIDEALKLIKQHNRSKTKEETQKNLIIDLEYGKQDEQESKPQFGLG